MKNSGVVSSAQALDDYFDALLLDDDISQHQNIDTKLYLADFSMTECELKPQSVSRMTSSVLAETLTKEDRDFTSIEKLLHHLKLEDDSEVEDKDVTQTELNVIVYPQKSVESDQEVKLITQIDTDSVTESRLNAFIADEERINPSLEKINLKEDVVPEVEVEVEIEVELDSALKKQSVLEWKNIQPEYAFQVLFFESFGVTYAVPLSQLGGIHRLGSCNYLLGRPDWYFGLQIERKKQIDVVDTAKWVMPEKIADNRHREDYNYIVLLGESTWGLACNSLLGTESLKVEQVRWRKEAGKRPWLAGLVKEKMCALIHVEAFVAMLGRGINANTLA